MRNIFSHRSEKLDWQKISNIDPLEVAQGEESGHQQIKGVLSSIAFCCLEEEFGQELLESRKDMLNLRLFRITRIAQLIIQYLLYHQEQHLQKIVLMEESEKCISGTVRTLQIQNEDRKIKYKDLKEELKKRKEIIEAQQECLFKDTDFKDFQKCLFCSKIFVNQSFLLSHLNRRHSREIPGKMLSKVQLRIILEYMTNENMNDSYPRNAHENLMNYEDKNLESERNDTQIDNLASNNIKSMKTEDKRTENKIEFEQASIYCEDVNSKIFDADDIRDYCKDLSPESNMMGSSLPSIHPVLTKRNWRSLPNISDLNIMQHDKKCTVQSDLQRKTVKRRMSKSLSSFRKKIYGSLQNIRHKTKEDKLVRKKTLIIEVTDKVEDSKSSLQNRMSSKERYKLKCTAPDILISSNSLSRLQTNT